MILVVDDEVRIREVIQLALEREGFRVRCASDTREARLAITQYTFSLLVLDIMLPRLSGYRVVEELRQRGVWTPVLMLTAKDGEYDQADAERALFAAQGLPVPRPSDFSTAVLQRTQLGHSGAQFFFTATDRAFCLHVVLGSHGRRAAGATTVGALLTRTRIGARS